VTRTLDLFAHGGEMGARQRAVDWSKTPLGPLEHWPQSLKTCVRVVLTARQPMSVWWGPELITLYNDAFLRLLDDEGPAPLGQPASVLWRASWAQIGPRAEASVCGHEGTWSEASLLPLERRGRQEGMRHTLSFSSVPGDDGGPGGLLCAASDSAQQATTLRELEVARCAAELARAATERATREAEAANRAKDEFLAMLGHELRNPLAPILTALELMHHGDPEGDARARVVIDRQVGHLIRLVDDLLDVSRLARGQVDLKKQVVEMATVLAEAIALASPLLGQLEQRLTVDVARQGLAVDGDVKRLAQVVSNLLTNAAKYSPRGSSIRIRAAREGAEVVLSVSDDGVGIAADMLPRVFDTFAQEHQPIDRGQGGLGLGLAIVRNLVAAHGGTVDVRSAGKGCGSVFTVRLPAVGWEEPAPEPESTTPAAVAVGGLRILVVDDNEDAAAMLGLSLRRMGHATRVVHDGLSALEAAAQLLPDVALLDIGLPVMDGYELARRLRDVPGLSRLHLVAVTGYGQDRDRSLAREAGFDVHLVKPVDKGSFKALLDRIAAERTRAVDGSPRGDETAGPGL
jgi:signal transduction histidine kinase/ActR/RegA family two-component response regulator